MGNPRSGQRPPQQAVRVGRFEQAMERFNAEMGQKVAASLAEYHKRYVSPLEARILVLETPWYRRAWAWIRQQVTKLKGGDRA